MHAGTYKISLNGHEIVASLYWTPRRPATYESPEEGGFELDGWYCTDHDTSDESELGLTEDEIFWAAMEAAGHEADAWD